MLECFMTVGIFADPAKEPAKPFEPQSCRFLVFYGLYINIRLSETFVVTDRPDWVEDERQSEDRQREQAPVEDNQALHNVARKIFYITIN